LAHEQVLPGQGDLLKRLDLAILDNELADRIVERLDPELKAL